LLDITKDKFDMIENKKASPELTGMPFMDGLLVEF